MREFAPRHLPRKPAARFRMASMCGRFALAYPAAVLQDWYECISMPAYPLRFNVAPGNSVVSIRTSDDGRTGGMMRWGYIPSWAKDPAALPMLHNARGETVAEKPMFRKAFRHRRCLIPASGFYEWKNVAGQRTRQPFYISHKDGSPLSFAGIWSNACTADGERVDTCAILTTGANAVLEPIHARMPVIIAPHDWAIWLSPEPVEEALLMELIAPSDAEKMQAWGVAHAVNKVTNDSPALLLPIA
jgi:putative SOS response-associated peptidase YedK